jgi:hypothetical protein
VAGNAFEVEVSLTAYAYPMGFGRESRRVRDESLPFSHRFMALGSWIQQAQPIGFEPTWAYLEAKLNLSWFEPDFLLPAMDMLEAERAVHLRIAAEYADVRRLQKAAGHRTPPRDQVTPIEPRRWHGDERAGARQALESWLRRAGPALSDPYERRIRGVVEDALSGSTLTKLDANELQSLLDGARAQSKGFKGDTVPYRNALSYRQPLGHLFLMFHEVPSVGKPWNFRTT